MTIKNTGLKMDNRACFTRLRRGFLAGTLLLAIGIVTPQPARAFFCVTDTPNDVQTLEIVTAVNTWTTTEFQLHQVWMVTVFFNQYILPAMQQMAEQLSAVAMQQMMILGTFLDAKHQLETNRLYQELAAQAHKDYHPSEGMCTIGTVARSLAASDRNATLTALMMAQHSLDRQLLNANSNASEGPKEDLEGRVEQFRTTYCDPNDNNKGLTSVCDGATQARMNKDIDYTRTVANPLTIEVDFSNATLTDDEEDLLALASNLYAHDIFSQIPEAQLNENEANQQTYMDMRSIVAKRSVAENSFQAIAAMKSSGATPAVGTAQYMAAVLEELGVSNADAQELIGENPSYYAQMEMLTKTILQRPQFFVDLYDKPANVARKGVALQALALMQDRDSFKSTLRSEAMLSVILELQVMKAQEAVQNEVNRLEEGQQ
ncbi:MAG: hypothetical protein ACXW4B_05680 [Micavibrio sp.]